MINNIGSPEKGEPVHSMKHNGNTLCNHGSYHVKFSDDKRDVNCNKCLEKMMKSNKKKGNETNPPK